MRAYLGRFAPSPTGLLHQGSLLAAVGSWLDAKAAGGEWLLRIEDLDAHRCRPDFTDALIATLDGFSLSSTRPVQFQSRRVALYEDALTRLGNAGLTFHCVCTRRELGAQRATDTNETEPCCLRDCRSRENDPQHSSLRVDLCKLEPCIVIDRSLGEIRFDPAVHRDVIIRRRDGIVAYHLAVVVDDAAVGVTDVVRGADLFGATAWQLGLQRALAIHTPKYLHLPVVTEASGAKLAKSRRSIAVNAGAEALRGALTLLQQDEPPTSAVTAHDVMDFALSRWNTGRFRGLHSVTTV